MLYQPESANKLIKSKSVLCAAHLLVMDGYEDLPILLSVIQSNKVNIYCIYIKNYPGIEWRRVAFIGVFPGVTSPRMGARGEKRKCQERASQISLSLHARLCPSPRRPARQPLPTARGLAGRCLPRGQPGPRSVGSRAAVKTQARSPERSQRDWPEEIWGVIEERESGGGTAPLCLLSGYIIF